MEKLIEVKNLSKKFPKGKDFLGNPKGYVYALNGVDFDIYKNETLGLVGESGCGKSTTGRCVINLITPTTGEVLFNNQNILTLKNKDLKKIRKDLQIIFQNPYSSLNPRMKIKDILSEPLKLNTKLSINDIENKIDEMLECVGLPINAKENFPHEFSGGQRQRIVIAKALILNPQFIVADEPISALDISIQKQIIKLLEDLKTKFNLTYLFISHDLSTVRYFCDRVAVMYLGEIVEIGKTEDIFNNPHHPYTKLLMSSIPQIDYSETQNTEIENTELPSNEILPNGCKYATRCPYVMNICKEKNPQMIAKENNHNVKCFLVN